MKARTLNATTISSNRRTTMITRVPIFKYLKTNYTLSQHDYPTLHIAGQKVAVDDVYTLLRGTEHYTPQTASRVAVATRESIDDAVLRLLS